MGVAPYLPEVKPSTTGRLPSARNARKHPPDGKTPNHTTAPSYLMVLLAFLAQFLVRYRCTYRVPLPYMHHERRIANSIMDGDRERGHYD